MPHGKICYLEIPAVDSEASANFYAAIFGWKTRTRGDGARAFDDATGYVSGAWVKGRQPSREAGLITYVMVESVEAALKKVAANGGRVVTPFTQTGPDEGHATFTDPAGNLMGLYQEKQRKV